MSRANLERSEERWCALVVGNSRQHWAMFSGSELQQTWDVSYTKGEAKTPQQWAEWQALSPALQCINEGGTSDEERQWPSLWILSVVPHQTQLWQGYPRGTLLQLTDIPLPGMYTSLGCDRALALWAAGEIYGWPMLVIDGGTALTLTGANASGHLVGGAILPGIALQLSSLTQATPLPDLQPTAPTPPRWAKNTADAMRSGVIHTIWAGLSDFIQSWCQDFSSSHIVLTGGDHQQIFQGLKALHNPTASSDTAASQIPNAGYEPCQNQLVCDETLLFQGIQRLRAKRLESQ